MSLRPSNALPEVFVYLPPVDFRKAVNGLAGLVQEELKLDPFSEQLYVFTNRQRDKIKILCWEGSGFVLWYKRLERQRFHWPRHLGSGTVTLTGQQLNWLLDGYDLARLRPHERLRYRVVA